MSVDEDKLQLDRDCLAFERQKHSDNLNLEARKVDLEVEARRWSQIATFIATFIPLLAIVVGYFLTVQAEQAKKAINQANSLHETRIRFIDRQLAELYYPIKIRLERDNAVWEVSAKNKASTGNLKLANDIEARLLLPNHEEIMTVLKTNFQLLVNPDEKANVRSLIAAVNRYQRHVTIYKALRDTNDMRWPAEVCEGCGYPKEFEDQIDQRIEALRKQREELISTGP